MTFTNKNLPNARNRFFQFFATGATHMDESFSPDFDYKLADIRLTLSVTHTSVTYFTGNLSAAEGAAYNILLMSVVASDLTNVQNQIWTLNSEILTFFKDDTIEFSMLNSDPVVWGLVVSCWSIVE
jgi:hypothetical protein